MWIKTDMHMIRNRIGIAFVNPIYGWGIEFRLLFVRIGFGHLD